MNKFIPLKGTYIFTRQELLHNLVKHVGSKGMLLSCIRYIFIFVVQQDFC